MHQACQMSRRSHFVTACLGKRIAVCLSIIVTLATAQEHLLRAQPGRNQCSVPTADTNPSPSPPKPHSLGSVSNRQEQIQLVSRIYKKRKGGVTIYALWEAAEKLRSARKNTKQQTSTWTPIAKGAPLRAQNCPLPLPWAGAREQAGTYLRSLGVSP